MNKIITIGAAVMDTLVKSDSFKIRRSHEVEGGLAMCEVYGGKLEAQDATMATGGGATNVAVGLRKFGESVKIITRIGEDKVGRIIEEELVDYGVGTELLQKGEGKTGISVVLVSLDGGRSIVTYRGESQNILGEKIDWEMLMRADWIQISSLGGDIQLLEDLVNFANKNGIRIGLNPGKKELESREKIIELLPKIDYMSLNQMEAAELWEVEYIDEKAIVKKFKNCSALVTITNGKKGASLMYGGVWYKMKAFPNKSVDDTGAGDAFVAGCVEGVLLKKSLEEILKMGLANGGSVVTKLGAKAGLLDRSEIERWMKKRLMVVEEAM